jgi:hypothetical protein
MVSSKHVAGVRRPITDPDASAPEKKMARKQVPPGLANL